MNHRASDLNKTKRAESVKKLTLQKMKEVPLFKPISSPRSEISIKLIVDEIIKYLIQIIEALLQEQNSNNYLSFIAMSEKMNKQLQRKIVNMMAEKCTQIKCQLLQKFDQVKPQKGRGEYCNQLKNERKNITQNILAYHRSNSFNSFGHKSQQYQKDRSNQIPGAEEEQRVRQVASIELISLQSKLSALQETQNNKFKQSLQKIQRKFDENCRDIKLMAQKHVQFKLSLQQKLELSLQSLWNVISDNQSKICQLERIVQEISTQ